MKYKKTFLNMEVSLRYTLLLIVFFSKMLDGRVSGVDGVDTPFTVMITRAPAVLKIQNGSKWLKLISKF